MKTEDLLLASVPDVQKTGLKVSNFFFLYCRQKKNSCTHQNLCRSDHGPIELVAIPKRHDLHTILFYEIVTTQVHILINPFPAEPGYSLPLQVV